VYLLGQAAFPYRLGLGPAAGWLVVAGPLLIAPDHRVVGTQASGVAQLAVVVGLMVVLLVIESRRATERRAAAP
jgi:hypothetical protein